MYSKFIGKFKQIVSVQKVIFRNRSNYVLLDYSIVNEAVINVPHRALAFYQFPFTSKIRCCMQTKEL